MNRYPRFNNNNNNNHKTFNSQVLILKANTFTIRKIIHLENFYVKS